MLSYKTNILVDNIVRNLERVFEIIKDPEHFLINKHYRLGIPNGFRIEFYIARKFKLVSENIRRFNLSRLERRKMISIIPVKKLREMVVSHPLARHPKKVFCPYCEKLVIPKRLHKLDFGDIMLFLFTAGLWAIFLFAMCFFIRRCPVCN